MQDISPSHSGESLHRHVDDDYVQEYTAEPYSDQTALFWFSIILGWITIGQRFAVPVAESAFAFGFLFSLFITLSLAIGGRLAIEPGRLVGYVLAMSIALSTLFFNRDGFSITSVIMLFVIYFSFILKIRMSHDDYLSLLQSFQNIMLFCVWCGFAQFVIQFVLSPDFMFPLDMILPEAFFQQGFMLRIPITESLPYEKTTGLWFLEPSHFSQFLGFAVIIELQYFNRTRRLALYLFSMALCFSGTGIILLGIIGSILVVMQGRIGIILFAITGLVCTFIFQDVFPFSVFYERIEQFANPLSSGSGRFFAPYWVIGDLMYAKPHLILWGIGPGEMKQILENTDYFVQDSSWFKMVLEYGAIATLVFGAFFLHSLFVGSPNKILSAACFVQFMLLGGYLLSFYTIFLYLILVVWPDVEPPDPLAEDENEQLYREAEDSGAIDPGYPQTIEDQARY